MTSIPDGMILPGDGNPYGFTAERFDGYLWQLDGAVMISLIVARQPGAGHFRELVETILASGQSVKVPTPFANMQRILAKNGFVETQEYSDVMQDVVEVWVKTP